MEEALYESVAVTRKPHEHGRRCWFVFESSSGVPGVHVMVSRLS